MGLMDALKIVGNFQNCFIESFYIYVHTFSSNKNGQYKVSTLINQWEDRNSSSIQSKGGFLLMAIILQDKAMDRNIKWF